MAACMARRFLLMSRGFLADCTSVGSSSARALRQPVSQKIIAPLWGSSQRLPEGGQIHTSARQNGLMEFFDDRKNWGEASVKCGRPWKLEELRIKSNEDLHKLWYVLLKERNVLMTMEAEYRRQSELFPSPERMEKVEESMENIQEIVAERDRAYNLLEKGVSGEPEPYETIDVLGRTINRTPKEHTIPRYMNSTLIRQFRLLKGGWQFRYLRLMREKEMKDKRRAERRYRDYLRRLKAKYPNADYDWPDNV